jgi:DNA polymerase III subunit epsilon
VHAPGEGHTGFAVIDVETTGFSPEAERIVEVGVVILDPFGEETGSFSTLIDPGRDPGPTHIHRITTEMITGAPTFAAVHPYLADQLSGRVVIGHNVDRFDLPFLRAECGRVGGGILMPGELATVDTLGVAQEHLGLRGKARLVDCCTHFGLAWDDHHTALGDARVTASLFRAMRDHLGDAAIGLPLILSRAGITRWPGGAPVRPAFRRRSELLAG